MNHIAVVRGFLENSRFAAAETYCENALERTPDDPVLMNLRGLSARKQGQLTRACSLFERAATREDDNFQYAFNLALASFELGLYGRAEQSLARCEALSPGRYCATLLRGRVARHQSREADALACFESLTRLAPKRPRAWLECGKSHQTLFDPERATVCFDKALALNPVYPAALAARASVGPDARLASKIETVLDRQTLSTGQAARLQLALGRCRHEQSEYAAAMRLFEIANSTLARMQPSYSGGVFERHCEALRAVPSRNNARDVGSEDCDPAPLFILGPSRSGKSVVEKLVCDARHDIRSGFENQILFRTASELKRTTRDAFDPRRLQPQFYGRLQRTLRHQTREQFADSSRHFRFFTATRPHDVFLLLPVLQALPKARLIGVLRHPPDIAMAMFMQDYERGNEYHTSLADASHYIRCYQGTLAELARIFPRQVMLLEYEIVTSQPTNTLERIGRFLGFAPRRAAHDWLTTTETVTSAPYAIPSG